MFGREVKDPRSRLSFMKSELFSALTTLLWVSGFHTETNLKSLNMQCPLLCLESYLSFLPTCLCI